jgi:hypothetical protein
MRNAQGLSRTVMVQVDTLSSTAVEAMLEEVRRLLAAASGGTGAGPPGTVKPTPRPVFVAPQITCDLQVCASNHFSRCFCFADFIKLPTAPSLQ